MKRKPSRVPGTFTGAHVHRARGGELQMVGDHCDDCGAPMCPVCGEHTSYCDGCGFFHCDEGHWDGAPLPIGLSMN